MAVTRSKLNPGHLDHWTRRDILPVYDSGLLTGNQVLTMDHPMRELFLSNDSLTYNVTAVITGGADLSLSFTLYPGETLNERFTEFTTVTVTAQSSWRYYVRSGLIP